MKQSKVKVAPHCPECFSTFDTHTTLDGDVSTPKAGSLSFCCYCGNISKFQKNGMLVELLAKDHIKLIKEDFDYYKTLMKTSILVRLQAQPGYNTAVQFN